MIYAGLLAFSVYQALPSQAETVFLKFRNAAYVLTVAWGLATIAVKQQTVNSTVAVAAAVAAIIAALLPLLLARRRTGGEDLPQARGEVVARAALTQTLPPLRTRLTRPGGSCGLRSARETLIAKPAIDPIVTEKNSSCSTVKRYDAARLSASLRRTSAAIPMVTSTSVLSPDRRRCRTSTLVNGKAPGRGES